MQNKNTVFIYTKIIFFLLLSLNAFSQSITKPDSIIVFRNSMDELLFEYKVEKGNTVYSISRFFKVDIIQIYGYNPRLQSKPLDVNSKLIIPFNPDLLSNSLNVSSDGKIKVFYRVGVKETLFSIAKIYFHRSVNELYKLNNLRNNIISPGQLLYVGNIYQAPTDISGENKMDEISDDKNKQEQENIVEEEEEESGVQKERPVFVRKIVIEDDEEEVEDKIENAEGDESEIEDSTSTTLIKEKEFEDNGLAIWNKDLNVKGIFVLNNNAKLYTLMELYNPLVNKKIVAKVIGRIPDNTYADNVKVILSPEAAKALRAIDQRFFVRYKYLK